MFIFGQVMPCSANARGRVYVTVLGEGSAQVNLRVKGTLYVEINNRRGVLIIRDSRYNQVTTGIAQF